MNLNPTIRVGTLGVSLMIGAVTGIAVSGVVFSQIKEWFGRELSSPLLWISPGMLVGLLDIKSLAVPYEWAFKLVNMLYYTAIVFALISMFKRIRSEKGRSK